MNASATLSSLAMLKVSIDGGRDYLEYLRPYVMQVIGASSRSEFTEVTVAASLRANCGLEIPHRTIQVLLGRLASEKYLRKESRVFKRIRPLPDIDMSAAKADADRHIASVVRELVEFAQVSKRELSEDAAMECLIAFLSQFSIPCLKSYLRGTALPDLNGHGDWKIVLVSQFVTTALSRPALFESFMMLAQGHMLANALLCPDLHSVTKAYNDVCFYLDTPILIQFLGLEGECEKQAIDELISLVQRLDGRFACFAHTYNELRGAIVGSANHIDAIDGRGSIVDYARREGRTRSDLLLILDGVEDCLKKAKIEVLPAPPYDEKTHRFEISEEVFSSVLDDAVNYGNPHAKDCDVKSVRSIYVLRKGSMPSSIERAKAVLVTNNGNFAKAAYDFGRKFEQALEVSAVITDFSLANTAWLKAPLGAPSLPQKEILSFAYAAQRPTSVFWRKVLTEAERLEKAGRISARAHQILRSSYLAQDELMRLTLGDDAVLTDESISETIDRVTAEIRREDAEKLEVAEKKMSEIEQRLSEQKAATEGRVAQLDAIKKRIFWTADRQARREAFELASLVWIAQALVAEYGLLGGSSGSRIGWVFFAAACVSGLMRLAGAHWDLKAHRVYTQFREWRCAMLQKREYRKIGIKH